MLQVAIIGLGDISTIHIDAIQNSSIATLVAACDVEESLGKKAKNATFYMDYKEMIEKEDLDCVHVCLPHYLHREVTEYCVKHNVHVFLEKPLARIPEEGISIVDVEKKFPQSKICVCLQNRFNKTVEKLLEIVASEKYGKVKGVKGLVTWFRPKEYYDVKPWRGSMKYAGGGVMINQSIHTLDLMQLIGGRVKSIRGSIDTLVDYGYEVEDTATAHIQFENGATGLFFATVTYSSNSSIEFQVLLDKAKLTIKDSILTISSDTEKKVCLVEDEKLPGSKFYYGASHAKLIGQFYQAIINDTEDYVHAQEAQTSLEMIGAIRHSSEIKKEIQMEAYQ
ncbi:Gfo/Idh/MocA family protein [Aquibacillus rhizosphaerae]|uniref:Gfo/Idh/MocA family oxidoreductase n=1 Tax=Aquibacillus rhizosphaerae TaxID=3051431 RepID=A0ABT7L9Z2_9BACI|nr:Gfo/Idh/MocA family oxidoreductase [Aquibacillus sp. LR5S19]MDL4842062.1 Gfo/Idh/MocA family oxidoreductase [Aquibacillus sp. LR5S19]